MRKFIIPALIAGSMFAAATPASALQYGAHNAAQLQIGQLHNQIARAQQRGTISRREANGLRRQAGIVQRNYQVFSRNGLTQREYAVLRTQVQQIRHNLRVERADHDRRRG